MSLGNLLVELGINVAAFQSGCTKATYIGKQMTNDLKRSFGEIGNSFSQLGSALGASFGPLGGVLNGITKGVEGVGGALKAASSGGPAMLAVAGGITAVGAAAAAAAVGISELAIGGGQVVEQLDLLSVKTGISIRDLQTLKAMGDTVNVPIEQLAMGFRRFNRALYDSGDATKRTSEILKKLGVDSRDPMTAFAEMADGIAKIEDPNKRAAYATQLFGQRIAQSLLPDLEKGRAGIEKYRAMVDDFGATIGDAQVGRQKNYKDSLEKMSLSWDRLKVSTSWALPYLTALNDVMAETVAHPFGIGFGSGAGAKVSPEQKAAADEKKKQVEASQNAAAAALTEYQNIKAGGAAAQELMRAQEHIKSLLVENTAESNHQAAIEEAKIPMLQNQAQLEKQRLTALLGLPKTTASAINAESVAVMKAYAESVKALGPASAEAGRELDVAAKIQTFYDKQVEQGIAADKAAKQSLAEYSAAVNKASLAMEDFKKSTATGKLLDEFSRSMEEALKKTNAQADAVSKIDRATASFTTSLDKQQDALAEEGAAYNELLAAQGPESDEVKKAFELLLLHTKALNDNRAALDANKNAIVDKISKESLANEDRKISVEKEYLKALMTEPEWQAAAEKAAQAEAAAIGLKGDALQKFLDKKKEESDLEHTGKIIGEAIGEATRPGQEAADNKVKRAALEEYRAGLLKVGASTKDVDIAIQKLTLDMDKLNARAGGLASVKLGFTQFIAESRNAGEAISHNITKALDGVATGFAKSVVAGRGFATAMREVGKQFAEEFLAMEMKRLMGAIMVEGQLLAVHIGANKTKELSDKESALKSILASAKSAAVKGWDAGWKFPPPLNYVMAPAFAAAAFAGAMAVGSFEQGGIVPATGMAKVHENEMVLPRPISEKVQKMTDDKFGHAGSITVHYSPTVHAVDGKGVGDMLNAHGHLFTQHIAKEMRRRNL